MSALDIQLAAEGATLRVNAPKGMLSATLRQRIAEHKQAILNFLRQAALSHPGEPQLIPPAPADRPSPLSLAQERLWFLEQLEPGGAVFNLCRAQRITGALNIAALEASLNAVMRRQEALRSKFFANGDGAAQATLPYRPARLKVADLSRFSADKRERESERLIRATARRPFDLSSGRLLRVKLLRESTAEHLLVICTHHMVADAWSMGILAAEIWAHYEALARGKEPELPELPVQYRDYAIWQRARLQGTALDSLLAYWRNQLDGAPPSNLPTDRPPPARQSYRGQHQPIVISEPLTAALNNLSRRENATLFMTLLAAFQVLLHRYTGQDDILVGTPVANRERPELETVIGLFVNTLVLRTDFSGQPSFTELLGRVRGTCLDAYARQELPFEKLIEALNPRRELNRHPLFQSMFVLQNTPRLSVSPTGLRLESVEVDSQTAQFDLSLYLRERDGKLLGYFEYASDLFDAATVERMAGHFTTLLQSIADQPERSVATLAMLSAAERHRLLGEWNNTAAEFPADCAIHELFEAEAERTPDAMALKCGGARLTYRELNRRANRLAHYLQRCGVGPEKLVGIMVERSAEMVVGLLGILKAGGAYVPLDPSYPEARLRFMLEDSQATVLVTTAKLVEDRGWRIEDGAQPPNRDPLSSVPSPSLRTGLDPRLNVVQLDRDRTTIEQQASNNPKVPVSADNAAYVIYTSGSTGLPKGVIGLHRAALNRFAWMWRRYPFGSKEVCCVKTSLSFVDSVWEIFGPLLQGVPLVIAPDEVAREPRRLIGLLAAESVTRIVLVPSLLTAFLDECASLRSKLPKLCLWTSSGEELPAGLARRFKNSHPYALLLNLYGSAEIAADVTCFECHGPAVRAIGASVPIGRPIANTQIYLLDAYGQPVPVGIAGELFVGGAGLARGYWQRPELTAEKFIANPFSDDPNTQLFRTGDLARYLPNGNIEYLGRADRQVKIRGQRVELGEVESALGRHPLVRQCVVVTRDGIADGKFQISDCRLQNADFVGALVAYVVPREANLPVASELRNFLRKTLPDFMLPSRFVTLDRLPLLPNGKVDRRSLPAPSGAPEPSSREVSGPRTKTEKIVAKAWRELLQLEQIAFDDDFFELGGHSLLAATLVARLGAAFDREISLRDFMDAPTIAAVAAKLARASGDDNGAALPAMVPLSLRGELPLSLAQEQFLKLDELISGAAFLHLPYGYRLNGPLDVAALRQSLQAIVDRHAVLRSVFRESRGRHVQIIRRSLRAACPLSDLSAFPAERQQEKLANLSRQDADRPFDLAKGPPFRFTLIRLSDRRHVLFVTLHHIIADQSSLRLLRAELARFYQAFAQGRPQPLADLSFQFADYTRWQAALLESGKLNGQIRYWQKALAGATPTLMFHQGRKRPRTVSSRTACWTLELDDALFASVRALARQRKTTPFVILLAALDVWLYRLTGCRDLRVGTLVANRGRRGTEGLIGYFVNAVVLRARVAPRMTFAELIDQARGAALGAFAHQDLPIEALARALQKERGKRRNALYQVMLNYRRFDFKSQTVAGLTIASYSENERAANPEIALTSAALTFDIREASTKLTVSVNFKIDLFDQTALDPMIASFKAVVEQAVALPERRLADFVVQKIN